MSENAATISAGLAELLRRREHELRDVIRDALLNSGEQKYIDLAGLVHDRGDESVADELIAVQSALADQHLSELRAVEAARRRLADGSITTCIDCKGEIGSQRLMANPVAVRCVECQNRFDRLHAHTLTPRM